MGDVAIARGAEGEQARVLTASSAIRDVAERDGVLAASGIPGNPVADCGIVLTNFTEVFVHSVLSVVLLLEC